VVTAAKAAVEPSSEMLHHPEAGEEEQRVRQKAEIAREHLPDSTKRDSVALAGAPELAAAAKSFAANGTEVAPAEAPAAAGKLAGATVASTEMQVAAFQPLERKRNEKTETVRIQRAQGLRTPHSSKLVVKCCEAIAAWKRRFCGSRPC